MKSYSIDADFPETFCYTTVLIVPRPLLLSSFSHHTNANTQVQVREQEYKQASSYYLTRSRMMRGLKAREADSLALWYLYPDLPSVSKHRSRDKQENSKQTTKSQSRCLVYYSCLSGDTKTIHQTNQPINRKNANSIYRKEDPRLYSIHLSVYRELSKAQTIYEKNHTTQSIFNHLPKEEG